MDKSVNTNICFNCEKNEESVPLLKLKFAGKEVWICPQCLPVLIHKPEELSEKLSNLI